MTEEPMTREDDAARGIGRPETSAAKPQVEEDRNARMRRSIEKIGRRYAGSFKELAK